MKRSHFFLPALVLLAPALGQSLNVDIGLDFGAPSSSYAGAAAQPGVWSLVDGDAPTSSLVDLTGASTAVDLLILPGTGSAGDWSFDNATTSGDDQALMDDFHDVGPEVWDAFALVTFNDLAPGTYDLYTYAWAPDDATFRTQVEVLGSSDGVQEVGGSWGGTHALGVTYARHRITTKGTIEVIATSYLDGSYGSINGFQLVSLSGSSQGVNYCGPANLNSSGQPGVLAAFGSDQVQNNFLELTASQLPVSQFGYLINSMTQGFVNPPGSQGNLCVAGAIGRHVDQVMSTGTSGEFTVQVDLTDVPTPGGPVAIQPGETWYWQAWYRDVNPTPTSNFTDGVCLTFF